MARIEVGVEAPELELADFRGQPVRLRDLTLRDGHHVVLVFNRGFT